jgi:hypothetical protein
MQTRKSEEITMSQHKRTYEARLNTHRPIGIAKDGTIRMAVEIQSGDPGRPVVVALTMRELEALPKQAYDAFQRHVAAQLQDEHRRREWESQLKQRELERSNRRKDERIQALEQRLERVHDITRPDRQAGAAVPATPEHRVLPVSSPEVTH